MKNPPLFIKSVYSKTRCHSLDELDGAVLGWRRLATRFAKLSAGLCFALTLACLPLRQALAQTTVNIEAVPLLALKSAPGLVMLTMSRDHRLFYAAYNDTSDINGDGVVDVGFKPAITYYGNFVSDRCYDYITSGANNPLYRPVALATATGCKVGATQRWHGNWLNWATTSRMDALRRVLYGGYRVVDNATTSNGTSTVLQGAFIPKDSHVWGKEFRPGRDTYDITQYTTLAAPSSATTRQHLFVVVSPGGNSGYPFLNASTAPVLRYITDADQTTERIWLWASADVAQGIASSPANFSKGGGRSSVAATDRTLRIEACVAIGGVREAGCKGYPASSPTVWKPTGTLHDYSVNDQLKFGLITGSYEKNYSGGVVRRNILSFNDEIVAATGQFTSANNGIARTIDRITIHGWGGSQYDCGYKTNANRNEGECKSWGAPVGEMMYEGLRYFSGKAAGTAAYIYSSTSSADATIGFPSLPAWENPFRAKASGGNPICSRPVQMVIADPLTSFDSDQVPGANWVPATNFGTAIPGTTDLTGLNVSTEASTMWGPPSASAPLTENLGTRNIFIGQSGTIADGNPTAKSANSFATIRGHAPDETQSQGSFYSAGVARFGRVTGIATGAPFGTPVVPVPATPAKVDTIAVALGSLTPKIELTDSTGKKVSIVPLSKAVGGAGINKAPGNYQATGAITGFYYANFTATSVSAVVNFSDGDQGTDNETDAQVRYDISLSGSNVTVNMTQLDRNPGGIQSNLGYVISGTTKDGLYLETRTNKNGTATPISAGDVYYLDTLPGQDPAPAPPAVRLNGAGTGYVYTPTDNNFPEIVANTCPQYDPGNPIDATQPSGNQAARVRERAYKAAQLAAIAACLPSWDRPTTRTFTLSSATSTAGAFLPHDPLWYAAKYGGAGVLDSRGDPTNYFKISNPADLPAQMGKAFRSAAALAAVASTSVVGVGQRSLGSAAIYQANYDSLTWSSRLYAFSVATSGAVSNTPIWDASLKIPAPASRTKLFLGRGGTTTPLSLTSGGFTTLTAAEQTDFVNASTYAYLLGDKSGEERKGGTFRNRGTTAAADYGSVLGDIVNSDPQIISRKDLDYGASDSTYTTFLSAIDFEMLAVGTNNGFFHIFDAEPDATGGGELLGFMPQAVRPNLRYLPDPGYLHQNFVDGAVAVSHAKIPVPGDPANSWRSVVVAAGGTGAQTVFAINATSKTFTANSILWEINPATIAASNPSDAAKFGKIMGRPGVGKLANGTWVAIFGNGFNSADGTANLFVVRLSDGVILKVIPTNTSFTGNGMGSTEIVRKTSGNRDTIEFVYGSDYKGNIWRFDLSNSSMASWPSTGALIYTTPTGRPITAEIKVGAAPASPMTTGGKMIYFGTGSYLSAADPATTTVQALYGVYDDLLHGLNSSPFVTETSLTEMTITMPAPVGGVISDVRTTSTDVTPIWYTVANKRGWVVPLSGTNVTAGERVIAPPVRYTVSGTIDALLFTSIVPSTDDCEAGLDAWITGVDAMTGAYRKVFGGSNANNSIRIRGGSPRGVFVLQDSGPPALYISQTIFNDTIATTTYDTSAGGKQQVTINGVSGTTQVLKVELTGAPPPPPPPPGCSGPTCTGGSARGTMQIWRQLK